MPVLAPGLRLLVGELHKALQVWEGMRDTLHQECTKRDYQKQSRPPFSDVDRPRQSTMNETRKGSRVWAQIRSYAVHGECREPLEVELGNWFLTLFQGILGAKEGSLSTWTTTSMAKAVARQWLSCPKGPDSLFHYTSRLKRIPRTILRFHSSLECEVCCFGQGKQAGDMTQSVNCLHRN